MVKLAYIERRETNLEFYATNISRFSFHRYVELARYYHCPIHSDANMYMSMLQIDNTECNYIICLKGLTLFYSSNIFK